MTGRPGTCPLTTRRIADEYFLENRHRLLDIAAFLDRLDRSADGANPADDFRLRAFQQALAVLLEPGPDRLRRVHMVFSDPTVDPREALDGKAAYGAYDPAPPVK